MYAFSVVGIRLLAAYFVFSGLAYSGDVFIPLFENNMTAQLETYQYTSLYVLTNLVIGVLIFVLAKPFSTFVTAGLPDTRKTIDPESVISSGSFLIGLYWTISNLPEAIYTTVLIKTSEFPNQYGFSEMLMSTWVASVAGLIVMLSAFRIGWLVRKIRQKGTK